MRVGIAYGAAVFVILQVADLVFPALGVPDWGFRFLVIASLAGLPASLVLAWLFDVTPEGVRRTGAEGERGPVVARLKNVLLYGGGAAVAIMLLVASYLWVRPRPAMGVVAPGADVIAVLPFSTSGADMEVMREGMVDLLSRNLDEVGVIRTVDSRTVLYRWEERAAGGRLPLEQALEIGRDVEAGSIILGSVLEVAGSVRMSAQLYGLEGDELASAEVEGSTADVLDLVDSLSVGLVKSIWRSRRPIPSIDLSAITTNDLSAIRHFLEGEQYYRTSQWDSAAAAFRRAIDADSLFALAHLRLSNTLGWAGRTPDREETMRSEAARALELADRLPARARSLVVAADLRARGEAQAAIDTLRTHVRRYPDDFEGWYFLADYTYHIDYEDEGPRRPPASEALETFDRALALDPSFAPALIHPLEVAFQRADTALIDRYTGMLARTSEADSLALAVYEAAAGAVMDPGDVERLVAALQRAFIGADAGLGALGWQAARAVTLPLVRQAARLDSESRSRVLSALRAKRTKRPPGASPITPAGIFGEIALLQSGGQLASARELMQRAAREKLLESNELRYFTRVPVYAGLADSTYLLFADLNPRTSLVWAVAAILHALDSRDLAALRAASARLSGSSAAGDGDWRDYLLRVADAFVEAESHLSARSLANVEAILNERSFGSGRVTEPFWFRWLERLAEHPESRREAIQILRRPWIGDPVFELPRLYTLARALEAEGDALAAHRTYGIFLEGMEAADPDLLVQRQVMAASEAIE